MRKILLAGLGLSTFLLYANPLVLENSAVRLELEKEKNYLPTSFQYKTTSMNYIDGEKLTRKNSPWSLTMRLPDGTLEKLDATSKYASIDTARQSDRMIITWKGLRGKHVHGTLDFEMTVSLRPDGASVWSCRVTGQTNAQLWQVDFPYVQAIHNLGDDFLALPVFIGRLLKAPTQIATSYTINYPINGSMQFLAYWGTQEKRSFVKPAIEDGWAPDRSDANGLLFHIEDGEGYMKQMCADSDSVPGHLGFKSVNIPSLEKWPVKNGDIFQNNYELPYQVVLRPFKGDVFTAAHIYRDWAIRQKWCSAGVVPDSTRENDTPPTDPEELSRWKPAWFRNAGFWVKYYFEPFSVLPEFAAVQDWLRVPVAAHYYNYNIARFDDNYPEHLPANSYFLNGMRAAKRMHVSPQPYNNGVIWDTDTQSWFKDKGELHAYRDTNGNYPIWNISNELFTYMCPASKQWHLKVQETSQKQIWEHEMCGVYYDCFAAEPAHPCYNTAHGHPAHGGQYHSSGNRALMQGVRKYIRQFDRNATFFCEEICEQFLDCMDGFLTLDYNRCYEIRANQQVYPLFNLVYNPYAITFGSDARIGMKNYDIYALQMGRLMAFGFVPFHSAMTASPPRSGDLSSELMKEIAQSYYSVVRALTINADLMPVSQRPFDSKLPASLLDLQSNEHTASYTDINKKNHVWQGPAVIASAFKKDKGITLFLINITEHEQKALLSISDKLFSGAPARTARFLWPKVKELSAVGITELTLPAAKVAVIHLDSRANAVSPERLPLLKKDWIFLSAKSNGPFPAAELPDAKTLYACDDSVVVNRFGQKPVAQMLAKNIHGTYEARHAVVPPAKGWMRHDATMPRPQNGQPFALLYQLPFSVKNADQVTVFRGDKGYLACMISSKGSPCPVLESSQKGIFTYSICGKKGFAPSIQALNDLIAAAAKTSTQLEIVIGFSEMNKEAINEAVRISRLFAIPSEEMKATADTFVSKPSIENLASFTEAVRKWVQNASACPALFAPKGPGYTVLQYAAALVFPLLPEFDFGGLLIEDDWLVPGVVKHLQIASKKIPADRVAIDVVGDWKTNPVLNKTALGAELTMMDFDYVEKLVPVIAWTMVDSEKGKKLLFPDVTYLECNRPYEMQTQPEPINLISGNSAEGKVTFRNWSPLALTIIPKVAIPKNWKAEISPKSLRLPACKTGDVIVKVTPPPDAGNGTFEAIITANHTGFPGAETYGVIKLANMKHLTQHGKTSTLPGRNEALQLRCQNLLAAFVKKGEECLINIENKALPGNANVLDWKLMDSAMSVIQAGKLAPDAVQKLEYTAKKDGVIFVQSDPKWGSAFVTSTTHPMSECANTTCPLQFINSYTNRYFYVFENATSFEFYAKDGGEFEPASVVITSPTGRKALARDGRWTGERYVIKVLPGENGKPWNISITPEQDFLLWFSGPVSPWLADKPAHILRPSK